MQFLCRTKKKRANSSSDSQRTAPPYCPVSKAVGRSKHDGGRRGRAGRAPASCARPGHHLHARHSLRGWHAQACGRAPAGAHAAHATSWVRTRRCRLRALHCAKLHTAGWSTTRWKSWRKRTCVRCVRAAAHTCCEAEAWSRAGVHGRRARKGARYMRLCQRAGCRHHEPARDDGRMVQEHGQAAHERHRVARHAHQVRAVALSNGAPT